MAADDDTSGWQLTESDPGVFTELLKTLGVPLVVDDLYSLDAATLTEFQPLHALIFLFKWVSTGSAEPSVGGQYDPDFPGFFAHQVVNNACATLAVMNAIANIPGLQMGAQLSDLFSFTAGMDPQTSGMAITSSDWLREAHNALSPPSAISLDGLDLPKSTEDAYHFIVYIPYAGSLYELDGLKQAPVSHGAYSEAGEGWVAKAREVIEARIGTYPPGSLEFSLLAVHDDPLPRLQEQLTQLQSAGAEASELMVRLANENSKRERWAFENSLRRHNYLGFIHALLLSMAKAGTLDGAKEGAKKALQERIERRKKGEAMDED
ncbi:ubiquitin carboxyl-terminal hydrolase [Dichomitus squalens]|uniref:Ubiquitin carboxyl-terminal hydrolase n=1 Tax=Dichomitus squalens TaxID=114155 RepID=A0A4Q9NE01_9APHY|nr:ubiquitin carboxyl-terminal hydrolase [Dichomitus squalens]TBU64314.1 ubiquitin carboxyl-terminal hydrolase [Dichomitus squalens]